jgi:hypothetical protein
MSDVGLLSAAVMWFASFTAGACLGELHGRGIAGAFLGIFLGPFGVIAAAVLPDTADMAAYRQREIAAARQRLEQETAAYVQRLNREHAEADARRAQRQALTAARRSQSRS